MGIAHVFWQAAVSLKKKEWEDTAIQILLHNSSRHDLQKNGIMDAGLCHGSAGVAHIFWNLYLNTHLQKFQETTDYWLDITMQMAKYTDGSAGFKAWRTEKLGGFVKLNSFLEGISGIGLVLLSHLQRDKTSWDECLMLS